MRYAWLVLILLITGCVQYPVNPDGTAWNPNGINYSDPNAVPLYGSSAYGYGNYAGYPFPGYPCGSYWGCGRPASVAAVVAVPTPALVVSTAPVIRAPHVARSGARVSLRSGGRSRGRR